MASSLIKWFISAAGSCARGVRREDYVKAFYAGDSEALERISYLFSSNNGQILTKPARKSSSAWKTLTVPAAERLERGCPEALKALTAICGDDFRRELADTVTRLPEDMADIAARDDFADSRFRTWLQAAAAADTAEKCASAMAMAFAEAVYFCDEGAFRKDGGSVVLEMMDKTGSDSGDKNNIYMTSRRRLESAHDMGDILRGATCVRLLNLAATSLVLGKSVSSDPHNKSRRSAFQKCLDEGAVFQIILPAPGSISEIDAGNTKAVEAYPGRTGTDIIRQSRAKLLSDIENYDKRAGDGIRPIQLCLTDCAIPHAIMIVTYDNDHSKDHVKVDLYSPYLTRDAERRSFFIYKNKDPENYNFFFENFTEIWNRGKKV